MTFFRTFGPLVLLTALAGCNLSPAGPELDTTTTGSIARADTPPPADPAPLGYAPDGPKVKTVIDGVAPSDWERIRLFASTHLDQTANGDVLDWTNPDTGSNGTISPLAAATQEADGRRCRAFALTISDVRGIRGYRGDACRSSDGMWQLFGLSADDGALL